MDSSVPCLVSGSCDVQLTINPQHSQRPLWSLVSKSIRKVRMSFKDFFGERNLSINLAELGGWVADNCDGSF